MCLNNLVKKIKFNNVRNIKNMMENMDKDMVKKIIINKPHKVIWSFRMMVLLLDSMKYIPGIINNGLVQINIHSF